MFGAATLTDEVVRAASGGSQVDLARVSEAMLPQAQLMVWARLAPTADQLPSVDDITQDVMLALTKGIPRLQHPTVGGLKAFVSGIVAHKVADWLRQAGDRRDGQRTQSLDSTAGALSEAGPLWQFLSMSGPSPSSAAGRSELVARLLAELGKLKPRYREVITLALIDELPTRDVAERMGMTRNAVAMLLKRAGKTLRENICSAVITE